LPDETGEGERITEHGGAHPGPSDRG